MADGASPAGRFLDGRVDVRRPAVNIRDDVLATQVVRDDLRFEGPVRGRVLEDVDNRLGRQSVPEGVLPRSMLSLFGPRASAAAGVPAVGFELAPGSH
jgi:hypothetical protein